MTDDLALTSAEIHAARGPASVVGEWPKTAGPAPVGAVGEPVECKGCGNPFWRTHRAHRYCRKCRERPPVPAAAAAPRECQVCDCDISDRHPNTVVCASEDCVREAKRRRQKRSRAGLRRAEAAAAPAAAPPLPAEDAIGELADLLRLGQRFIDACAAERDARTRRCEIQARLAEAISELES